MKKKSKLAFCVIILALSAVGFLALLNFYSGAGALLIERATGKTPERILGRYIEAVASSDGEKALAAWDIPEAPAKGISTAYYEKAKKIRKDIRERTTRDLRAKKIINRLDIQDAEWWSTCCMPHVLPSSYGAGRVKLRTELTRADGEKFIYIFVLEVPGGYDGELDEDPVRDWKLTDAYPEKGDAPAAEPIIPGWKVYQSDRLGFRIDYPEAWQEKDDSPNYADFINFASPDTLAYFEAHKNELTGLYDSSGQYFNSESDISIVSYGSGQDSNLGAGTVEEYIRENGLQKVGEIQVDGVTGNEIISGWESTKYVAILFEGKGRFYEMRLNHTPDAESVSETQKKMISSFRFLD
jgi:hypothetical protein